MDGPRLTEERLRHYLDTNQAMRERLCLALLPLLGPYTREQPRRPKGGPDGGRDLEAIYQGAVLVWGAVGFKNGGGADESARAEAEDKFKADLDRALVENPSLSGFVFFTNVDLTPTRIKSLREHAKSKNVNIIDIFDMERLRHVLDSPEGLIARLQYLDIPMSATEQASLVAKFGGQLQNAVTARFDRVERTLAQMERFLDFQKPLLRLDLYIGLAQATTSAMLGDEAVRLVIHGLQGIDKAFSYLCVNHVAHQNAYSSLVTVSHLWPEENSSTILSLPPSISHLPNLLMSFSELSITTVGRSVRIADLTILGFEAFCTDGVRDKIKAIALDANGYQLLCCVPNTNEEVTTLKWPDGLKYDAPARKWMGLVKRQNINLLFSPPNPSGRFSPLQRME